MRSSPGEWMTMRRDRAMSSVTALLYGGGAALLATSVLLWSPGKNPRWVLATLALVATAFCAQALWRGSAFTTLECLGMLAVLQACVGALTWTTPSSMAAFSNGSVLPLVAVYASWFLSRDQARLACYGGIAWWLVAVLQREDPLLTGLCLSVVVQTAAAVEVFSRIRVRLESMARTDALTGALNRWGVQDVVGRHVLRGRRHPFSVALLDVDDLRAVNTSGGHRAGDALLADVVRHLRSGLRACDSVQLAAARSLQELSGEEVQFACFDTRLCKAARTLGMASFP